MKTIRLDIDYYNYTTLSSMQELFISIPKPFMIRKSAGKNGHHIKFVCPIEDCMHNSCYDCFIYAFDDKRRLKLNIIREIYFLSHNVLWDVKSGRKAGFWKEINTYQEFISYIQTEK